MVLAVTALAAPLWHHRTEQGTGSQPSQKALQEQRRKGQGVSLEVWHCTLGAASQQNK